MIHDCIIFFEALFLSYISYCAGSFFMRYLRADFFSSYQYFSYSILAGYGLFGIIGLLLGLLGIFNAPVLWLFVVVVVFVSRKSITAHLRFIMDSMHSFDVVVIEKTKMFFAEHAVLKAIIVAWVFVNIFIVFVPITGHDTLDYHLPIMMRLADTGSVHFSPNDTNAWKTILAEIIFSLPIVLFHNVSAPFVFQLLQYGAFILFLLLLYDFTQRKVQHSILAVSLPLLVLSMFDFQREVMHGGYIDVILFLFCIASTCIIIENYFYEKIQRPHLIVSAFFLGVALSMKYLALFFLGFNSLLLFFIFLRKKTEPREFTRLFLQYMLIVFCIAGFWYVKNAVYYGSPVYPMFSDNQFDADVGSFMMERTLPNFFWFPFYRFGQWLIPTQVNESSSRLVVLGYFALMYCLMGFLLLRKEKWRFVEIILFVFIELYTAFSFWTTHQIRFLLPAIILLPVFLTILLDRLFLYVKELRGDGMHAIFLRTSKMILPVVFFMLFLANFHYFHVKFYYKMGGFTKAEYIKEIGGQ